MESQEHFSSLAQPAQATQRLPDHLEPIVPGGPHRPQQSQADEPVHSPFAPSTRSPQRPTEQHRQGLLFFATVVRTLRL
jgi:hypothetical protein